MAGTSEDNRQTPLDAGGKDAGVRSSFINSMWADITGAAVTVATGVVAAYHSINKAFYQNLKVNPKFKNLIEKSQEKTLELLHRVEDEPTRVEKRRLMSTELPDIHRTHDKAVADLLRDEYGIENVMDKAMKLRPHQKREVITKVATAMAVALGAVVTAAAFRSLYNEQKEQRGRMDLIEKEERDSLALLRNGAAQRTL